VEHIARDVSAPPSLIARPECGHAAPVGDAPHIVVTRRGRRLALSLCLGALGCVEGRLEVGPGAAGDAADLDARAGDAAAPDGDAAPGRDAADLDGAEADGGPRDAAPTPDAALPDAAEPPPLPPCPAFDPHRVTGNLADPAIVEASGLAQSWRNADVLWTHNDSGDTSRVFALTTAGEALGVYELEGGRPSDWEDMAVGPGPEPGASYLYMGDVGDNAMRRANIRVRRVAEPEVVRGDAPFSLRLGGVESFTLVYPDGAHNCETLLVDPLSGDVYVVVKSNDGVSPVYRAAAPLSAEGDIRLERVANLTFGQAPLRGNTLTTGGTISPAGDAILVRTYGSAFLWRRAPGATVGAALATEPCPLPLAPERQGEAIGYAADGSGYFTVSEGASAPLHFYRRR
jgi:hypothetical protein